MYPNSSPQFPINDNITNNPYRQQSNHYQPFQNYPNQNYPSNQNFSYDQNNYQQNYDGPNENMNYPIHSNIPEAMEMRERPFVLSDRIKRIMICVMISSFAIFFIVFFTMSKN